MELTVGDQQVLLTTHKKFNGNSEAHHLRALAGYRPLQTYLRECAASSSPIPDAVVVRRFERVAQRVTESIVDLVYRDSSTGVSSTHELHLQDSEPAVLLPIIDDGGRHYAVMARQPELSQGLSPVVTAFHGRISSNGGFAEDEFGSTLAEVGIRAEDATPLSPAHFTVGSEGAPAVRVFTVTAASCEEEAVARLKKLNNVVVVPVEDVARVGDAAALLAVSLWSTSRTKAV